MKRPPLLKLTFSATLVAAAVGIIVYTASRSAGLFRFVDEVNAQREELKGKELWMAGKLVPATHRVRLAPDRREQHRFTLAHQGQHIVVLFTGSIPQGMKPGRELIVRGRLSRQGHFRAAEIRTKCPSKYRSQYEARR